jgi:hypothetical protein
MSRQLLHSLPKDAVFDDGAGTTYRVLTPSSHCKHPKTVEVVNVNDPADVTRLGFLGDYEVEVLAR